MKKHLASAIQAYLIRSDRESFYPKAALIDMDGVLYDSMPYHTAAWHRMMTELGVKCSQEEFYLYEGMTGRATIRLLFQRNFGKNVSDEECERLYSIKSDYFNSFGKRIPMPGAYKMLAELKNSGIKRVLVTGSGQKSLIGTINSDFPEMFDDDKRVTANDVMHGKPDPEPYLKGLEKAGVNPYDAIVIENAPLGVEAGHKAGCFVIAVNSGPINAETLSEAGADIIFDSMEQMAAQLPEFLELCRQIHR